MHRLIMAFGMPVLLGIKGGGEAADIAERLADGDLFAAAFVVHQPAAAFQRVGLAKFIVAAGGVAIAGETESGAGQVNIFLVLRAQRMAGIVAMRRRLGRGQRGVQPYRS